MKKTKQIIITGSMIVMFLIIGISVFKNDDLFPKNNLWNKRKEIDEVKKENSNGKEEESLVADCQVEEEKTFKMGEGFITDDLTFKVNSVEKTKERKQFPKLGEWDRVVADEEGNLINDVSYVIINVTIKNNKETERMFPLNSCWVNAIDDKNEVYTYQCWMSSKLEYFDKKDYFEYNFKSREEYTCDLVYIIEDERLDENDLFFKVNISGVVGYNDDTRYVKIN